MAIQAAGWHTRGPVTEYVADLVRVADHTSDGSPEDKRSLSSPTLGAARMPQTGSVNWMICTVDFDSTIERYSPMPAH